MNEHLMPRDEVAALLGISPESVRKTLGRHGITEQRGYPREAVENLKRPGRGYRTDLKENRMTVPFFTVETDAVTGAAQTIASEALGFIPSVSQGGRLGTELTLNEDDAKTVAKALEESGHQAWVS